MSGKAYAECCEPVIKGTRKAATPEELMRSRYSAYAKAEIDHIIDSTHKRAVRRTTVASSNSSPVTATGA